MTKKGITFAQMDGSALRVGLVVARWNSDVTDRLEDEAIRALRTCNVADENIVVQEVPGSFELVRGAKHMIDTKNVDAVVCLGVLVKGDTMHFEYISQAVSAGIAQINIETNTPVIFGVLTCLTADQAIARSSGDNNHGYGWGMSAVEMALMQK